MIKKLHLHVHEAASDFTEPSECLVEDTLEPRQTLTVHLHEGECQLNDGGYCQRPHIGIALAVDGQVFFTLCGGLQAHFIEGGSGAVLVSDVMKERLVFRGNDFVH